MNKEQIGVSFFVFLCEQTGGNCVNYSACRGSNQSTPRPIIQTLTPPHPGSALYLVSRYSARQLLESYAIFSTEVFLFSFFRFLPVWAKVAGALSDPLVFLKMFYYQSVYRKCEF